MLTQQKMECKLWIFYRTTALQKKRLRIYVLLMNTYKSIHKWSYSGDPHDSIYIGPLPRAAPTFPDGSRPSGNVGNCRETCRELSGNVGKCRDIENIQKIPFSEILFKHRHVTPRWKSFGLSIKEMTILGHFDLLGPKNEPKRVNMDWKYNFLKFCSNIGMWPLVGNGLASRSWIKWFWAILTYLGRFFSFFRSLSQAAPTIPDIYRPYFL